MTGEIPPANELFCMCALASPAASQRRYSLLNGFFAACRWTVQLLQFCQPLPYLIRVFRMRSSLQINRCLGDSKGTVVFASRYFSQQEMQLRKTRAHVQELRLESALVSL